MENDMPNWAPTTFAQNCFQFKHISGGVKPAVRDSLAVWNLTWLFDYGSMSLLNGTIEGVSSHHRTCNGRAIVCLTHDVDANVYKIKDLAETLGPVEFINTYMRRPYQQTMLFQWCGEEIFTEARSSAEKLAISIQERVESAKGTAEAVIQSAQILQFKKPA